MKPSAYISIGAAVLVFLAGMSVIGKPEQGPSGSGPQNGTPGVQSQKTAPMSRSNFLFNTFITITVYDSDDTSILDDSMALCKDYENIFSKTLETSELYRLNHRGAGEQTLTVSDDMAALLKKGLKYCELSGGAFDITVEPLSSLWDFTAQEPVIPEAGTIRENASRVGYENLVLDGNTLTFLSPDTTIDLGAIAKGYIADRVKEQLLASGVKSAIINLGGNVLCVGQRPDGSPFHVSLRLPFADRNEVYETLLIDNQTVVVSGVYERHFFKDGKNYHHLLNPFTGYPYDNGLLAVTIVTDESVDGDGLSTSLFSLGLEEGLALADSLEGVYACFIDEDYEVYYSDGFEDFIQKNP